MNSGEREHDERSEQRLDRAGRDLLGRDRPHRHRCEHAVFDLARVAEVLHERERDRLHALEDHRARDHAADEQRRELADAARAADRLADLREHVREHEDQQQRLHDRAAEEHPVLLAQHGDVAQQQRAERVAT